MSKGAKISIHALVKRATGLRASALALRAISIHALVKRATVTVSADAVAGDISIHALVKRATRHSIEGFHFGLYFNPRPREEGDVAHTGTVSDVGNFNPRPREEGDLGIPNSDTTKRISIHALVKRATIRQQIHRKAWIYFNPRPREEGDYYFQILYTA